MVLGLSIAEYLEADSIIGRSIFQPNHLDNGSKASVKPNPSSATMTTASSSLTNVENSEPALDSPDSMKEIPLLADSGRSEPVANGTGNGSVTSKTGHSRQSSVASSHSNESGRLSLGVAPRSVTSSSEDLGDCHHGIVVALHRKMVS